MLSQYQMEFIAGERIREAREAAAIRWLLRSTAPARPATPPWWIRFVDRLPRVTLRRAAAG